ncbi:MAG: type I DNA topoisomerase [Succinivibrio sp.]
MAKSLVIVESPSKASIINRYLGDDYVVRASVGHIRDLATAQGTKSASAKGKKVKTSKEDTLVKNMGINPKDNWSANYAIMPDKVKVVAELKKLSKEADVVYLATDLDREGEAIAWHLKEVLGGDDEKYLRVKYPEITKSAIAKAFENPGRINMDLVNAQQTRRFLDRVVGFMVSPLLWKKVARGLSAGRVQSVAVELIVDKEREIKAFIPDEYWNIDANVQKDSDVLKLALALKNGKKIEIHNKQDADRILEELKKSRFVVSRIEKKNGKQSALPPFTTSTLQQVANQKLGFSVRKTMTVAQRLYEQGLITYMRTDSVNLSDEAISTARDIVLRNFGDRYIPEKPNYYQSKESAQEAHEAIRPSHPLDPLPSGVDRDGQRLFDLIKARYLASQMTPQLYETTSVSVDAGEYTFRISGRHIVFDGFKRVYNFNKNEEVILPDLKEGEELTVQDIIPSQHFTQPPARFSEATLVKELEKDGIGRPSTYASIISTIQERGYVTINHGRFYAERMGEVVTDRLRFSFKDLMDKNFTASMEDSLDKIAQGQKDWIESLNDFYKNFEVELEQASKAASDGGMPENKPLEIKELKCPECGKYHMAVQSGKTGMFLSCLGYYDKDVKASDRCHKTLNLRALDISSLKAKSISDEEEATILRSRPRCPICHSVMDSYIIDETHKLHLCSTPNCGGYKLEEGRFDSEIEKGPEIVCDKCGQTMILKEGRFGPFMSCTNKECGNTRKILKNGEVAPPRESAVEFTDLPCKAEGAFYVLRDGAAGIFLAANTFPKVRETRPPKVIELKERRDLISPKFYYLADAPAYDDDGNETEVRFSRKTKQQYLISVDSEGKPTSFVAFYNEADKKWEVQMSKSSGAKKSSTVKKTASRKVSTGRKTASKKTASSK